MSSRYAWPRFWFLLYVFGWLYFIYFDGSPRDVFARYLQIFFPLCIIHAFFSFGDKLGILDSDILNIKSFPFLKKSKGWLSIPLAVISIVAMPAVIFTYVGIIPLPFLLLRELYLRLGIDSEAASSLALLSPIVIALAWVRLGMNRKLSHAKQPGPANKKGSIFAIPKLRSYTSLLEQQYPQKSSEELEELILRVDSVRREKGKDPAVEKLSDLARSICKFFRQL